MGLESWLGLQKEGKNSIHAQKARANNPTANKSNSKILAESWEYLMSAKFSAESSSMIVTSKTLNSRMDL